jgi:hypothetical protein
MEGVYLCIYSLLLDNPMLNWQNKIHHLRKYLRGWARDLSGKYKLERDRLTLIIDYLDKKSETIALTDSEREALKNANDEIATLRRVEESKWAQRAKVKYIQERGSNTRYFHLIANRKHRRKKHIMQLEQDEGTIIGQENLKTYISEYYKSLFGPPEDSNVSLVEDFNSDIPQLSHDENNILISDFPRKKFLRLLIKWKRIRRQGLMGSLQNFLKNFGILFF